MATECGHSERGLICACGLNEVETIKLEILAEEEGWGYIPPKSY